MIKRAKTVNYRVKRVELQSKEGGATEQRGWSYRAKRVELQSEKGRAIG